ncbi:MAG TPA: DUF5990 family protein [Pyrinomonadaceae bacterium]|nr:DUF5990 family protein [Pyrinomonadaceae bacterium]
MSEIELPLRITIIKPPAKVRVALQRGKADLFEPTVATGADLSFSFTVRVKGDPDSGPPRFLGEFTQGPPALRFVYVNSGQYAGERGTDWARRAKIPLGGIDWPLIIRAQSKPNSILEVKYQGTARDGGPTCASVKLPPGAWTLVNVND